MYGSREVYERLGVSSSSLRKWSLLLESKGYVFTRDTRNNRLYKESDITVLERYKALVQERGVHQEIAAHVICNPTDPSISDMLGLTVTDASVTEQRENNALTAFAERMSQTFADFIVEQNKQTQLIEQQTEMIRQLAEQNEVMWRELNEMRSVVSATLEERSRSVLRKSLDYLMRRK